MTTYSEAYNIFNVLDNEKKGYITVDKFITSFHEFYKDNDDEQDKVVREDILKSLILKMQPDEDGKIRLQNFLSVFQQIQPEKNTRLKAKRYSQYSIKRFLSAESFEASDDEMKNLDNSQTSDNLGKCFIDNDNDNHNEVRSLQSDNRLMIGQFNSSKFPEFDDLKANHKWPDRRLRVASSCKNLLENSTLSPSAAFRGRDLYSAGASPRGSEVHSGIITQEIGSNFDILQMQMKRLEQKLKNFHSDQYDYDKKQSMRIKEENKSLIMRINNLEDSLRELEERAESRILEEKKNFKQKMVRAEEDKRRELESVQNRLYKFEGESADFSLETRRYRDESEKLRAEKHSLTEKLTESDMRLSSLQEDFDKLRRESKSDVDKLKKEKEQFEKILLELNSKFDRSYEKPQMRIQTMNNLSQRHKELEDLLEKLKQENKDLLNQIEESNLELRERSAKESKDILNSSDNLSKELDHCNKEELMDILAKSKDSNFRLRDYIEKIIVKVMDKQPSLLEVPATKK